MEQRGTNEIVDDAMMEWYTFQDDPRINNHGIFKALEDMLRLQIEGEWGYSSLENYARDHEQED